ncbi:hypothetical protein FSP39_001371 [Pinctada imbricata]|uniref:Uncharacterized protein n=1 Tax=Pinctada imbricata TaxID=66713 RepID=A0AA88XH93_PINIB|nr:hypothetical protein FSP39_001371 [Pinctada imbricata]
MQKATGALALLVVVGLAFGFDHNVVPKCGPEEEVCVFDWTVDYVETMIYFGGPDGSFGRGEPVVVRNGSLYRRTGCDQYVELNGTDDDEKVLFADGNYKLVFAINGQVPGPTLTAYEGQQVIVNLKNNLLMDGITIHWHGMVQTGTPWMDGVGTVSHCPINPGETFQYSFLASPEGTHWYHSHLGTQRTDGMAGALVVLPRPEPEEKEARKGNETVRDPEFSGDYVMVINDWKLDASIEVKQELNWGLTTFSKGFNESVCYSGTREPDGGSVGLTNFESALINGRGQHYLLTEDPERTDIPELPYETFKVNQQEYYRFRVINTGMLFAFRLSVDQHDIQVISTDGNQVKTAGGESIVIHTGERADVMIYADKAIGNYWIRLETLETENSGGEAILPNQVLGILSYVGANNSKPTTERRVCTEENKCKIINCPFERVPDSFNIDCVSIADLRATDDEIARFPVPRFESEETFQEVFLNFHFSSSAEVAFTSAVNGHNFVPPAAPPQIYPEGDNFTKSCEELDCSDHCSCTYTVKLDLDKTTQVIIVNMDDAGGGMPHPIHMHGHHFHVLKIGYPDYDPETGRILQQNPDIYCETPSCNKPRWADETWKNGNVDGINLDNPPLKDTIIVPRGGYVVLRMMSSNPGFWFMHCHIEIHQIAGMALILQEGDISDMAPTPPGFPTCGNFFLTDDVLQTIRQGRRTRQGTKAPEQTTKIEAKTLPPRRLPEAKKGISVQETIVEEVDVVEVQRPRYPALPVRPEHVGPNEAYRERETPAPKHWYHHHGLSRKATSIVLAFLVLSVALNIIFIIVLCVRKRTGPAKSLSDKKRWFADNIQNFTKGEKTQSKTNLIE